MKIKSLFKKIDCIQFYVPNLEKGLEFKMNVKSKRLTLK